MTTPDIAQFTLGLQINLPISILYDVERRNDFSAQVLSQVAGQLDERYAAIAKELGISPSAKVSITKTKKKTAKKKAKK